MSKTLTVSDETYEQLERLAGKPGVDNIEQYLASLWEAELRRRREVASRIHALRERLFDKYGYLDDSVEMIREDRDYLLPDWSWADEDEEDRDSAQGL